MTRAQFIFTAALAVAVATPSVHSHADPAQLILGSSEAILRSAQSPTLGKLAVANEILLRFGKIFPPGVSDDSIRQISAELGNGDDTYRAASIVSLVAAWPSLEGLVFDGRSFTGANYSYIDGIIGTSGLPIGLDRQVPYLIAPLPGADASATKTTVPADGSSGVSVRRYQGKFDDLYFHLYQNGNAVSQIAFWALVNGLGGRTYSPTSGITIGPKALEEPFNLDDILSNGGRATTFKWATTHHGRPSPIWTQFSYRVFAAVAPRLSSAAPGTNAALTPVELQAAMRAGHHLYPTGVPALCRSGSHFYGFEASSLIFVRENARLTPEQSETFYPLPLRDVDNAASTAAVDEAHSSQLFSSSTAPEMVWEDPVQSHLLSDAAKGPVQQPAASQAESVLPIPGDAPPQGQSARVPANIPPKSAAPHQRSSGPMIVVVGPTKAEADGFAEQMRVNDDAIRVTAVKAGTLNSVRHNLLEALHTEASGELREDIDADLSRVETVSREVAAALLRHLQQRATIRQDLQQTLRQRLKEITSPLPEPSGGESL